MHRVSPTEDIKMGYSSQKGPDAHSRMQVNCIKKEKRKKTNKASMEIQCFLAIQAWSCVKLACDHSAEEKALSAPFCRRPTKLEESG